MIFEELRLFTSFGRGVSARARSRQTTISSVAPRSAEPRPYSRPAWISPP